MRKILNFVLIISSFFQFTSAFAQENPPCPSQFTQSCTFMDDILQNKHFKTRDNYHHSGNGETNYYLSSQITSSSSLLTLSTKIVPPGKQYNCNEAGSCKYISGWVDTQGLWSTAGVNHGYVEVSATMPVSPEGKNPDGRYEGMWPAIWMLPNDEGAGWPTHGEIDISELHGANPFNSGTTLHYNTVPGSTTYYDGTFAQNPYTAISPVTYASYHTYGLEWNFNSNAPYLTTWYDGKPVAIRYLNVADKTHHSNLYSSVFLPGQSSGFYLILNIATGGAFGPTTSNTSDGSGKDMNNPTLQMNINSIKSWRFND